MQIEEIVRSCVHADIAEVAVACIGRRFSAEIKDAAASYGMTMGAFVALSVERFARHGDETDVRAVRAAMIDAQEPILAGLHRILCIMLAAGMPADASRGHVRSVPTYFAKTDQFEIAACCEGAC